MSAQQESVKLPNSGATCKSDRTHRTRPPSCPRSLIPRDRSNVERVDRAMTKKTGLGDTKVLHQQKRTFKLQEVLSQTWHQHALQECRTKSKRRFCSMPSTNWFVMFFGQFGTGLVLGTFQNPSGDICVELRSCSTSAPRHRSIYAEFDPRRRDVKVLLQMSSPSGKKRCLKYTPDKNKM